MRETATHYDVRFFGGKYERALLVKSLVKSITTSKENLQVINKGDFNFYRIENMLNKIQISLHGM